MKGVAEGKSTTDVAESKSDDVKDKSTAANTASLKVVLKKLGPQLKKAQSTIRFQKAKESGSEVLHEDEYSRRKSTRSYVAKPINANFRS